MTEFAKGIDKTKVRHYLLADTKEEIDSYCEEKKIEIVTRPKYVDPTMVCHHFIWVGKRPRPAQWKIV
jgi:hypothetical protein